MSDTNTKTRAKAKAKTEAEQLKLPIESAPCEPRHAAWLKELYQRQPPTEAPPLVSNVKCNRYLGTWEIKGENKEHAVIMNATFNVEIVTMSGCGGSGYSGSASGSLLSTTAPVSIPEHGQQISFDRVGGVFRLADGRSVNRVDYLILGPNCQAIAIIKPFTWIR